MLRLSVIGNLGNEPEVLEIPLTRGMVAVIDAVDAYLAGFNWCAVPAGRTWYAVRAVGPHGKQKPIYMHRMVLGDGARVDHRDRNGLNNRRNNLRAATPSQNNTNSYRPVNKSGFRGVVAMRKKWRAQIRRDGQRTNLGFFDSPVEAARAYDEAAVRFHGEFATLNFPQGSF